MRNTLSKQSKDIDRIIGGNLRTIRLKRGLTQIDVADALGCTFQQVQKYEKGKNRISASVVYRLCGILGAGVLDFYAGLEPGEQIPPLSKQQSRWLGIYDELPSDDVRQALLKMAERLLKSSAS
jgi:transcriptional regulator with XRE-family HTH domain